MKKLFAVALVFFVLLFVVAQFTLDRPPDDGVVRLRWATDPNPARDLQTEIFGKLQVHVKREDLPDWPAFAGGLVSAGEGADRPDRAALKRLWDFLPEETRAALRESAGAEPGARVCEILDAVNRALDDRGLFGAADAAGLELPYDARLLLDKPPKDRSKVEVAALNRRILEAAMPAAIRKAVRVEATVEPGAREKLIVQCATGVGPDVIDIYGKYHMMTLVEAGILVDLTPYAAKMGFGPNNTYPSIRGTLMAEGKQYRFPCNVWANCIVYNKRIFDAHGLPYPKDGWTYAEFIAVARKIQAGPDRYGHKHLAVAHWNPEWVYDDILFGYGGRYFSQDGLFSRLDSPEAVAAMQLYHDLMHKHNVLPSPAEAAAMSTQGGWGSGGLTWFSNERAAMIFIGRWYLCQVVNYPKIHKHLAAVRLPRVGGYPSRGVTDCRGAGINITSPHKQAALKFLQYLASEDYGQVIVNDGDSLPPNPALARTGKDLVNAVAPDPNFHRPFIDAMAPARPLDASGFIDAGQVKRWVNEMIGKVENQLIAPPEAMRTLAAEINQRIRRNLERRSDLREKFRKVTGREYRPNWWRARRQRSR